MDPPICDQIMLERQAERYALAFDVPEVYPSDVENMAWERAIREVKRQLMADPETAMFFNNVSGIIDAESVMDRSFVTHQAFVFVTREVALARPERMRVIPAGDYLIMYFPRSLQSDGSSVEYASIGRMLDYAAAKGLVVDGSYYGETLATGPLFDYDGREAFFKMNLPVRRASHNIIR